MHNEHEERTWRELLGSIIQDKAEKKRIASAVEVTEVTLVRWVKGGTRPQEENLRALLRAIPSRHVQELTWLAAKEFPGLQDMVAQSSIVQQIPAEFYAQMLRNYANTANSLSTNLQGVILEQALKHLDPDGLGLSVSVMACLPPAQPGGKVRSLREIGSKGSGPWKGDLGQKTMFLGADSLAGAAVMNCRLVFVQSRAEQFMLFPAIWAENEESAAAFPIMRRTRIFGCLLVSSALPKYFTVAHLNLIEQYANLLALAFESDAFYALEDIELRVLPPYTLQMALFRNFSQRVSQMMFDQKLSYPVALLRVWQEIEQEMLEMPISLDIQED